MKRHRSPYILVATAGVAALALSAAGCTSSTEKPGSSLGGGVDALVFAKRMHTTVGDDGKVEININGGTSQVIDYGRYVPERGAYGKGHDETRGTKQRAPRRLLACRPLLVDYGVSTEFPDASSAMVNRATLRPSA